MSQDVSAELSEIVAGCPSFHPPVNIYRHRLNNSDEAHIITPLPNSVVNKIAAGEVILRPVNAIKELVENSLDAGATNIQVIIEDGGLTSIQVIDNGHGISKFNALLLCQRHSTSKLSTCDDLSKIKTFGFRGEALASISAISRIKVATLNKSSDKIGWQATYKGGKLEGEIEQKYVPQGTKIYIDRIFDDIPIRKQALKSSGEERKLIVAMITKYAIHNCNDVTLSLREAHASSDLVCSIAPKELKCCIGSFFGPEIEKNSSEISIKNDNLKFECQILFSQANSNLKHFTFLLFINNRLVECPELKRDVDAQISQFITTKAAHPFVYIRLLVQPADIDVNVHPAKTSVTLHYQSELIELIIGALSSKLIENQNSKKVTLNCSFSQPTLSELTGSKLTRKRPHDTAPILEEDSRLRLLAPGALMHTPPKRPSNLVHNHHSERKLTELFNKDSEPMIINYSEIGLSNSKSQDMPSSRCDSTPLRNEKRSLKLRSVQNLRHEVGSNSDPTMTSFLKETVFVGSFHNDHALVQSSTKLYVLRLEVLLKELYYQLYLYDFGAFGTIDMKDSNRLSDLISPYIAQASRSHQDLRFNSCSSIIEKLIHHSAMLEDYFSISINSSTITKLPMLVPGEEPNYSYLGKFLVQLANLVNWEDEQECFRTIGRILAEFYAAPPSDLSKENVLRQYNILLERKLYPLIKQYLFVPRTSIQQGNFYQISDTTELYKVFERC